MQTEKKSWHKGQMVGFDTETTSPDPETARIVSASIVVVGPDGIEENYDWLVNPGVEIPEGATAVHGISTERAQAEGTDPKEAIDEIILLLASFGPDVPLVAFNARFDFTVLDREARRNGLETLDDVAEGYSVVDPFVLDKQYNKYRKGKRTLGAVCLAHGVSLEDAHSADADALAACRLAYLQAEARPAFSDLRGETGLHELQVQWARQQGLELGRYFARTGKDIKVATEWPLVPFLEVSGDVS